MGLNANDKSEDVRQYAQHDPDQWRKFLASTDKTSLNTVINKDQQNFTKDEARNIIRQWRKWGDVPSFEMAAVRERINQQLRLDQTPEVDRDVINWRMPKVLKKIAESQKPQGESSQSTDQPEERLPQFDPIRDT